jgi:hypothetical protein
VTVSDHDLKVVPQTEQTKINQDQTAEVARIQTEQRTAATALAEARKALAAHHARPQPVVAKAAPGDEWADAMHAHEKARAAALADIDAATVAWLRARIAVHEQEVEHARSELAVMHCRRELSRAYAVNRHLLGDDTYDTAPFRGQLASVQTRWYSAELRSTDARVELQRASTELASAKDRYAQLVRTGPNAPSSSEQVATWSPSAERDRNHRLRLVHAAAAEPSARYLVSSTAPLSAHYLVPPPHR